MLKKIKLSGWTFIGMFLGIAAGLAFLGNPGFTASYIKPFGTIYINLLKFLVVPVVLVSIMDGVVSLKDIKRVGRIGGKTFVYYMVTTAIAIVIGLIFANIFKGAFPLLETTGISYEAKSADVMTTIVNIFPSNMWSSFVNANMLQVIVIAVLFGLGILLAGEKGRRIAEIVNSLNDVVMKVMMMVIKLTPIGVFCLMCNVVAENGPKIVETLAIVIGVAYLAYLTHIIIVYGTSVRFLGGVSVKEFFKKLSPAMICAFTTTSSNATLPLNIECCDNLGADHEVSSFVLPLGATINMDGTAIYMGVTSIFIASCYGVELTLTQMATIVLTATLASIGTAGVSGAGMIMLAMVLQAVNLPVAGIGLIVGVDKIFDMGRTTLNITGDATCALYVSRSEHKKAKAQAEKSQTAA